MTLVILEYVPSNSRFRCIADSRICNDSVILMDCAPKILPISLQYWILPNTENGRIKRVHVEQIGFAFCGSTLAAMSTYAWASSVFSQLIPSNPEMNKNLTQVSLIDVGKSIADTATRIVRDLDEKSSGSVRNDNKHNFKAFVFGYCHREMCLVSMIINYIYIDDLPTYQCCRFNIIENDAKGRLTTIGSGTDKFKELYEQEIDSKGSVSSGGIFSILKMIIDDNVTKSVGGHVWASSADINGFSASSILTKEKGEFHEFFMGQEITNFEIDGYRIFYNSEGYSG